MKNRPKFKISRKVFEYFEQHKKMLFGEMYFRLYNPQIDSIVEKYDQTEWSMIFEGTSETDIKELNECINVVILLWCKVQTEEPCGMLYLEESHLRSNEIVFHGGTWNHNPKLYVQIFRSLSGMLMFILSSGAAITTTCGLNNKRADRFQKWLFFEEKARDEFRSYKTLNKERFEKSAIIKRYHNLTEEAFKF